MLEESSVKEEEYIGLSGALWYIAQTLTRDVLALQQKFGLCEIVARVLASRNIPLEDVYNYLFPTLKLLLPDPLHLLDMDKAVARICQAIHHKESVVIFGDYDVDGATSSAMLQRYLMLLGINAETYIPDRIEEGYGPNVEAMLKLRAEGHSLCITVDCGTVAHEPIAAAKSVGLDVIVVDHHIGGDILPDAIAVVNPNRLNESSSYTYLAAVGTSFLLLVALQRALRLEGFFSSGQEPDLMAYLDLVALGTVCDVMPMVKLNRAFVKQGLKVMSEGKNTGIRVLCQMIGIEGELSAHNLGFGIGPYINAGGRVGSAGLGTKLLSSDDASECARISSQLVDFNLERKELENQSLREATMQAEKLIAEGKKTILVQGYWHVGIIGIVAGRLKEKFHLPSIVISLKEGSDVGKASARSVSGVDMGAAVLSAKFEKLILEGGGHEMAAGFSVHTHRIDELYKFFLERFSGADTRKRLQAQGVLTVEAINLSLCRELKLLEPFGVGNPEPRFILKNVTIRKPEIINNSHMKFWICDGKNYVKGICFRCVGTALGMGLSCRESLALLGKVSATYWKGNEYIQFVVDDVST